MCIRKISNIFLAIMATLGIMYYITTSFNATVINNIICIPVLILYYICYILKIQFLCNEKNIKMVYRYIHIKT